MAAAHKAYVAFHLSGRRPSTGLEALDGLGAQPALFAHYRDLTTLRYDLPLVLIDGSSDSAFVQSLSDLVNQVLGDMERSNDGPRAIKGVLRLEQEIRILVRQGSRGLLSALWDAAAERLGARPAADGSLRDALGRARAALKMDGEIVDCDAALPARVFAHAWRAVQAKKADRLEGELRRLALRLSDILRADAFHSAAGQSAANLKASVGSLYEDSFDFEAMSRVLTPIAPVSTIRESRRRRIRSLIAVLRSYAFSADAHVFTNCGAALGSYRARFPQLIELARAMAMAGLEIEGEYREMTHDPLFAEFGGEGLRLDPQTLARFPDYLVCVNAGTMDAGEQATLMEILSAGLPMKILVQSDDILDESPIGDGHLGFGTPSRQLANMAIGLGEVYVLQTAASHLVRSRDQIRGGLTHPGPALFSVFSGATGQSGDLPPYLTAAAAVESRAFPIFSYDPSAGTDWASRLRLDLNPQVEQDWPIQTVAYEDEEHQRVSVEAAFTLVDFVASDRRYARHFAIVPRAEKSATMIPIHEALAPRPVASGGIPDKLPCILMVDPSNMLHQVLVDEKLLREARRCRDMWHSLQELGGIHNSHAERRIARERIAREQPERREPEPAASAAAAVPAALGATDGAPAQGVSEERGSDEPYIETPRCTTCNECTQINAKMFAYNENRQAYIANPDAGTYAQLVEAAESCQVSIIHPGKPRNSLEPGLDELIKRAESFL